MVAYLFHYQRLTLIQRYRPHECAGVTSQHRQPFFANISKIIEFKIYHRYKDERSPSGLVALYDINSQAYNSISKSPTDL